ncbi:MAG: hypothetical protein KC613_08730, partial [Myxococcales bacterium]|nr:hypothetical protein [Myxococcales bacterium]
MKLEAFREDDPGTHASVGQDAALEHFEYDDKIVRDFVWATVLWGVVGMLVGLIIAYQLVSHQVNFDTSFLTFGRLRPL